MTERGRTGQGCSPPLSTAGSALEALTDEEAKGRDGCGWHGWHGWEEIQSRVRNGIRIRDKKAVERDESKEQASGSTSMIHPIVYHPATQRAREPGSQGPGMAVAVCSTLALQSADGRWRNGDERDQGHGVGVGPSWKREFSGIWIGM